MTFAQVSETGPNSHECCLGTLGTWRFGEGQGGGDCCLYTPWDLKSCLWGFQHGTSLGKVVLVLVFLLLLIHWEPSLHSTTTTTTPRPSPPPPETEGAVKASLCSYQLPQNKRPIQQGAFAHFFLLEEDLFSLDCINSSEHSRPW